MNYWKKRLIILQLMQKPSITSNFCPITPNFHAWKIFFSINEIAKLFYDFMDQFPIIQLVIVQIILCDCIWDDFFNQFTSKTDKNCNDIGILKSIANQIREVWGAGGGWIRWSTTGSSQIVCFYPFLQFLISRLLFYVRCMRLCFNLPVRLD